MTRGNFKSVFKKVISLFISMCIIGQSSSTFAMQTPKQQREEFIEYLIEEQDRYKQLFDQEVLLDVLDYDTDKIIDFVSNKIVYQAYDGVLRGAKGTLIGRAGNSHDQAITLAGMLNDAGLEAEILVGKLTAEQATELNLTIASPEFSKLKDTMPSSKSIMAKKISAKAEELVRKEGESISSLMEETDALAKRIFQQLPEEQIKNGMNAFKASVQSSAISYRWVRYRLAQGKKWIEVHPAYTDAKKWNLTPESFEKKNVNPEDLQQFSVEVWIENSVGEKHSITGLWKKPAANLLDHTLTINITSDAVLKPDLWNKKEEILKQSHFFYIQIDGKLPKEGKVFDLNGNIYSGDSLAGLNSVFSTLNKKTQKAADTLSSLSFSNKLKVNSKKQLTKVWLEFTLDKPNTESKKIKRVIFGGKALDETSETAARLIQRWDIDIATTKPMQQFYQNEKSRQAVKALAGADKFKQYFESRPNAKQEKVIEKYGLAMGNLNTNLLTHKRSIFDSFMLKESAVSYINEPNLLAVRNGFNISKDGIKIYEMTDIISNQRWSFYKDSNDVIPAPNISLEYGIWETKTEYTKIIKNRKAIQNKSAYKTLAQISNYSLETNPQTSNINLYDEKKSVWWNIDLQTGSSVGMIKLEQGIGGSDTTEYMIILINSVISGLMFAIGTTECLAKKGTSAICCYVANALVTAAGMGFATAIAAKFAKATNVVFNVYISGGTDLAATIIDTGAICSPGGSGPGGSGPGGSGPGGSGPGGSGPGGSGPGGSGPGGSGPGGSGPGGSGPGGPGPGGSGSVGIINKKDSDGDGVIDFLDNCPKIKNPEQEDSDKNGVGDVCEKN